MPFNHLLYYDYKSRIYIKIDSNFSKLTLNDTTAKTDQELFKQLSFYKRYNIQNYVIPNLFILFKYE